jgi:glutaredoxin
MSSISSDYVSTMVRPPMIFRREQIVVYSKPGCPHCEHAAGLLNDIIDRNKTPVVYFPLDQERDPSKYILWVNRLREGLRTIAPHHNTFPWIFFGDYFVGGYSDLKNLYIKGELAEIAHRNNLFLKEDDF